MTIQARLTSCWRYPVKSMQGLDVPELHLDRHGAEGDREWALVLDADGKLASAKRFSTLLMAHADDDGITLPDGEFWSCDDPGASAALSGWLGRSVTLERATPGVQRVYDMTFDPPNDDAEFVEIPAPEGTFHDWAPLHLVVASTVQHCQSRRAGIEWHIRRFRPNLVLDADLGVVPAVELDRPDLQASPVGELFSNQTRHHVNGDVFLPHLAVLPSADCRIASDSRQRDRGTIIRSSALQRLWCAGHPGRVPNVRTVVVSGAPGTGKSTLAAALADSLQLPLLSLDHIKEALADVLGLGDELWSNRVGDAAAELVFRLAKSFPGVVAEGWWRRDRRVRALEEFQGCIELFCRCDPAVAQQRATARLGQQRHPIHRDVMNPTILDALAAAATEVEPLGLGGELIEVDTTYTYDLDDLVARVTVALGTST